jgi:RHS repeat-associated protein
VVERAAYKPKAVQTEWLSASQPAPESKGRTRERFDADAGLQYLNARYYDPVLGMFIQPDWFDVMKPGVGTNRFSYSFNDPINKADANGNQTVGQYSYSDFWSSFWASFSGSSSGSSTSKQSSETASSLGRQTAHSIVTSPLRVGEELAGGYDYLQQNTVSGNLILPDRAAIMGGDPMAIAGMVPMGRAGKLAEKVMDAAGPLGRGGSNKELVAIGKIGDDVEIHHIPQTARGFTTKADGGAIGMAVEDHSMTRTFGTLGRKTNAAEQRLSFRDTVARDIRDVRSIDRNYTPALREMMQYYRSNFPDLMRK